MFKFTARHISPEKVSGKHDRPGNHSSHTETSRNRVETNDEEVPPRRLSQKLAKEDGESFHLRAAAEVGANGGLKSFAIERRRVLPSPREESPEVGQLKNNLLTRFAVIENMRELLPNLSERLPGNDLKFSRLASSCAEYFTKTSVWKFNRSLHF